MHKYESSGRINISRRIDKEIRSRKESSSVDSINQQTSKMRKGEVSIYLSLM
jgi:hypothetical protein